MIIPGESGAATGLLEAGKTIVSTISDGVTAAKQTLYDAVFGVFGWVKDLLFPSSDAKEGAFMHLTATGTAIVTTIAAGVTASTSVLTNAIIGSFADAFSFVSLFDPFEGESVFLDEMSEGGQMFEGPLRFLIGLQKGFHSLWEETDNDNLFTIADGISTNSRFDNDVRCGSQRITRRIFGRCCQWHHMLNGEHQEKKRKIYMTTFCQ